MASRLLPRAAALCSSRPLLLKTSHCTLGVYPNTITRSLFQVKEDKRIRDIIVNPESIGSKILPGNLTEKYYEKTNNTRIIPVELARGYFWMMQDIKKTDGKPTLSNRHLIPAKNAQPFPSLSEGIRTLNDEAVLLPDFLLRKNRSEDENAQTTLVAISCRDHGYNQLKSWTKPFQEAFQGEERAELVYLHLTEGWFSKNVLQWMIKSMVKRNTPLEEYDNTLLCFGKDLEEFRDALRIHNVLAGYVFLLDGIGRVRFAGSGPASPEELERVIAFANELTPLMKPKDRSNNKRTRRKIQSRI